MPKPPAGFVLDDQGRCIAAASKRIVTIVSLYSFSSSLALHFHFHANIFSLLLRSRLMTPTTGPWSASSGGCSEAH
jgi:hypothetical protein